MIRYCFIIPREIGNSLLGYRCDLCFHYFPIIRVTEVLGGTAVDNVSCMKTCKTNTDCAGYVLKEERCYVSGRLDGTAKYPVKFPTEAQLRDKAGRRAAMLARDGLDATKLQDRLGSLRP